MDKKDRLRAICSIVIDLVIYTFLLAVYAVGVFEFLMDPLTNLYHDGLAWYAVASLALIVVQVVALERITSFLMNRLRFTRFD